LELVMIQLRAKSSRAPFRRAGVAFPVARQLHEFELPATGEGLSRLISLKREPVISAIEYFADNGWHPVGSLDGILAAMSAVAGDDQTDVSLNTILPTPELTLKREASDDNPPASDGSEETQPIAEAAAEGQAAPADAQGGVMPASETPAPAGDAAAPEQDAPGKEPETGGEPVPASTETAATGDGAAPKPRTKAKP
jgi:hypothetical protein